MGEIGPVRGRTTETRSRPSLSRPRAANWQTRALLAPRLRVGHHDRLARRRPVAERHHAGHQRLQRLLADAYPRQLAGRAAGKDGSTRPASMDLRRTADGAAPIGRLCAAATAV